jgi:hypothetical protein
VVSPIGSQPYLHDSANIVDSFSITLLINLMNQQSLFYIDIHTNTNTKWDFFGFVAAAITAGHLVPGDFLIVDNALIHFADETRHDLLNLLDAHSVCYLFLPMYSPELNPCELVFAYVKCHICDHCTLNNQVHLLLLEALAVIPYHHLVRFYHHCVQIQDCILAAYLCLLLLSVALGQVVL